MKRIASVVSGLCLALLAATVAGNVAFAGDLTLTSGQFKDGDYLTSKEEFARFGCEGQNLSPSLSWSGAPAGTKSFALTVYDPDAPTGSGWWHWIVVDLPATTTSLPEGAGTTDGSKLPQGAVQVRTDFGAPGYGGPCPPPGDHPHRYLFRIYALDLDKLDVTAEFLGGSGWLLPEFPHPRAGLADGPLQALTWFGNGGIMEAFNRPRPMHPDEHRGRTATGRNGAAQRNIGRVSDAISFTVPGNMESRTVSRRQK